VKSWVIYSYTAGFPNAGGFIETSIGRPYAELRKIAKQMNHNGDGQRYVVREDFVSAQFKPTWSRRVES
jgi:hypothetical protein